MANMSYCRFQNTLNDLRDCDGALDDLLADACTETEPLSPEELRAARSLVELCFEIAGKIAEARGRSIEEVFDSPRLDREIAKALASTPETAG